MITDIFFDNDGVLVDTEPLFFQINKHILKEFGVELSWEEFEDLSLCRGLNVIRAKIEDKLDKQELTKLIQRRDKIYNAILSKDDYSKPGIKAVVKTLSQRFRLTIVTGSMRNDLETMHKRTGLLDHFHTVISSEDYEHPKPHPEPYFTAIQRIGVVPENCIVIEDSYRGLESAKMAGIQTIMYLEKPSKKQNVLGATVTCFNLTQIYHSILRMSSKADNSNEINSD